MDLPYLHKQLNDLNNDISYILSGAGFDRCNNMDNVKFDTKNSDALLLKDEFLQVLTRLDDVKNKIDYLNKPIIGEYTLRENQFGKYECEEREFHCGYTIEYYCYDDWDECYKWIISRVEHDGNDYYIVGNRDVPLEGLKVRIRR